MLNFYGMRLANMETGEITRAPDYWKSRFLNLRMYSHNFLRVNRILASLGHLGFHRYRRPWIEFLQREIREEDSLLDVCEHSLTRYWEMALDADSARFRAKTLEEPEDREDSVFFHHLSNDTTQFQDFRRRIGQWEEDSAADRKEAIERDLALLARWEAKMRPVSGRTRSAKAKKTHL